MQKIIVIVGQTATGKSDLAVSLAKKFNGEVISADSRQVYKGLDISTGKITKSEMNGIPHHLLDVVKLGKKFSVVEYQKLAFAKIDQVLARGKVPIICGGTGFYIDSVINGTIMPEVAPNPTLRAKMAKKSPEELVAVLEELDPARAKDIKAKNEQNNKVRLVRAIEIARALGKVPHVDVLPLDYDFIKVGLWAESETLKTRIDKRLKARQKAGMVNEIKKLKTKNKLSYKYLSSLGLEARYVAQYLQSKISKTTMIEVLNKEIYNYAKRQMTWFKRDKNINWFEVNKIKKPEILKLVQNFLKS